jgi:hypothetical protein
MDHPNDKNSALLKDSLFFKELMAERDEILRHKWLESEKARRDIGFEKALLDWIVRYRSSWLEERRKAVSTCMTGSNNERK